MKKNNKSISEKILRPRLKILGYILLILALCSFVYAILAPSISCIPSLNPPESLPEIEPYLEIEDFVPHKLLNFYAVSCIFFLLSLVCFKTSLKKKKRR